MEGTIHLDGLDVFNVLNAIQDLCKSQEEYNIYKKAADTWFKEQLTADWVIKIPIECCTIKFGKTGKFTIK